MNAQQAWVLVCQKIPKTIPTMARETPTGFIFSLRPSTSNSLVMTSAIVFVDKTKASVQGLSFGDPRRFQGKELDVTQFKEGGK